MSPKPIPPLVRFMDKVKVDPVSGCWLWQAYVKSNGYGVFGLGVGSTWNAHRWSYVHFKGPIPAGLQLDHVCRVRHCVNPDHLEPVTPRTNTLRGVGLAAQRASRTACANGHDYTPENTYTKPNGCRDCRVCRRARKRKPSPLVKEAT